MADTLPKFIAIKSVVSGGYGYYMNENDKVRGYVRCQEESVFSPFAKIEVEAAKTHSKYVHLRFCHSNKYWARRGPDVNDGWIVACSDQPEEDTSKSSCTLFNPAFGDGGRLLYLAHVSGGHVRTDTVDTGNTSHRVYVDDKMDGNSLDLYAFTFVDWDTLVKMPQRVAFKGDNGKYLKAYMWGCQPYLQFSSEDGNEVYAAHEVELNPDGHARIKSEHFGKFFRRSTCNWILGDSTDDSGKDKDTLFWPVKVDNRTIGLRSAGNSHFCSRLTAEGNTNCLSAAAPTITREARLVVEQLVFERNIYNVRYRMEDARIYDEQPFLAGIGTASNHSDTESSLTIRVSYEDTRAYSFSKGVSIMGGVETTIETKFPWIVEGKITVKAEITGSFVWDDVTEEKKIAEGTYTAKVPARSRARVKYVGTRGRCSVPFSYTQRDKSSSDGHFITSQHIDGIYTGVNYYNLDFEELAVEPL